MMPLTVRGTTQLSSQTPFLITGVSTVVQVPSSQVNENLIPCSVAGLWRYGRLHASNTTHSKH